jgi:hypothetical protein
MEIMILLNQWPVDFKHAFQKRFEVVVSSKNEDKTRLYKTF